MTKNCEKQSPCCNTEEPRIEIDEYGRPTIIGGETDYQVFEMVGYAMAEQRLTTLVQAALFAEGRLSEVYGISELSSDLYQRSMTYSNADLLAQYAQLPQRVKDINQGWLDGVNRYINDVFAGTKPMPAILNQDPLNIVFKPGYQIPLTAILGGYLNTYSSNLLVYPYEAYNSQDLLLRLFDYIGDIKTARRIWSDAMGLCANRPVNFRTTGFLQTSCEYYDPQKCMKEVEKIIESFTSGNRSLESQTKLSNKNIHIERSKQIRKHIQKLRDKFSEEENDDDDNDKNIKKHGSAGVVFSGKVTENGKPIHLDLGQTTDFPNPYPYYRVTNKRYDFISATSLGFFVRILDVTGTYLNKKTGYSYTTNYTSNIVNTRDLVFETLDDVVLDRMEVFKINGSPDVVLPIYQSKIGGFTNYFLDDMDQPDLSFFETIRNVLFWKKDILNLVTYEIPFAESFEDLQCKLSNPWINDLNEANVIASDSENRIFTYTMYAYQELSFPKFTRFLPQDPNEAEFGLADPLATSDDYFRKPVYFNYNQHTRYYTTWNASFDNTQHWNASGRVENSRSNYPNMLAKELVEKGNITINDVKNFLTRITNSNHGTTWNSVALNYSANNWKPIYKKRFTSALKKYGSQILGHQLKNQILELLKGYDGKFVPACDKNDLFYGFDIDPRWVLTFAWLAQAMATVIAPHLPPSLLTTSTAVPYPLIPQNLLVPTLSDPLRPVRARQNGWESVFIRSLNLVGNNSTYYKQWLDGVGNIDEMLVTSLQQALSVLPSLNELCTNPRWGKGVRRTTVFTDPTGLTDITIDVRTRQMFVGPILTHYTNEDKCCKAITQGFMLSMGGYSDLIVQDGDEYIPSPHYTDLVTPAIVLQLPIWEPAFRPKKCEDNRKKTKNQVKLKCDC